MADIKLRSVEGRVLTNTEVDDNFNNLNTDKLEIDGSNNMSGKLTTVISSTTTASILLTPGSGDPSAPASGDFWNNSGDLKFYDGSTVLIIATTNGEETLTNKTLTSPVISDGIYFEGTTADDNEILLTAEDATADRTVTLPDSDGTVVLVSSNTIVNNIQEIDSSSDLTLDAAGDIILDSDGADVILKDSTTEFGRLSNSGNELVIKTGTTSQTALTLSSSGGDVAIEGDLQVKGNDIKSSTGSIVFTLTDADVLVAGDLSVQGDLLINGTTTTINSTTVTIDDPIFTMGGDTAPTVDDNKDRGVEFRWHNGTTAKVGFFGFDDSTGHWTFIPDATNTSEVFSGTKGVLDVSSITGTASAWTTARTLSLTGEVTGSASIDGSGNVSISTTISADSVALGTDTTGNYVASVATGTGLTGGASGSEGGTLTLSLSHLGIQNLTDPNADRILFWDDSAGATAWLGTGTGISISGTTISNSGVTSAVAGNAITVSGATGAVTINHADTSTQSSVNNSGRTFIQDITLDTYGHVTGIVSATDSDTYVGTVTSVATGTGLTGGTITSTGTISLSHLGIQNLTDPNADRILFWDDSAGATAWLTLGTNLTITGTTINAAGGGAELDSNNSFLVNTIGGIDTNSYFNVAIGRCAGNCLTTGTNNNFFGYLAGCGTTYGGHNNFFGNSAGRFTTTGTNNNFLGECAGCGNTTGNNNNFLGSSTGIYNSYGSNNNFLGYYAGGYNTTGSFNNILGYKAGNFNSSGASNNFLGNNAGRSNTSGSYNIFIGDCAGGYNTTGCNNILIGRNSGYYFFGLYSDHGFADITTQCNRIILGNNAHTCAQIKIAWTVVSDVRDKCIYGAVERGLGFLKQINPIKYSFKDRETNEVTDPDGKLRYGFSAQEILELEGDENIIVSNDNPDKLQLTTDYLVPVLVNAIKELSQEVETLKERISVLENTT